MANYKQLIFHLKLWEGDYSCDPHDRGGATFRGITLATYTTYRKSKGLPTPTPYDLKKLTDQEWLEIFKTLYWDKCLGDQINSQSVANMLVDWYFNSGVHAIRALQKILGVKIDGVMGRKTLEALNKRPPRAIFDELRAERLAFYWNIAEKSITQKKFLKGWRNRTNAIIFTD